MDKLFDRLYVVILEDDEDLARSMKLLFAGAGWKVDLLFTTEGLDKLQSNPDLMLIDIELPGASGLDLLNGVEDRIGDMPKIIITGKATIERTISAFRLGAADFFLKPFDPEALLTRAYELGQAHRNRQIQIALDDQHASRLNLLTPREKEVLEAIADGFSSKEIGNKLGLSARTIEVHRAKVLAKLGAATTAEALSTFHRKFIKAKG